MINMVMGGPLVGPWDIDLIPEDWLVAFESLALGLPKISSSFNEIEQIKAKWRSKHPTYRKH